MGCIRVDKITEYLCEPLAKCLKDEDPYVRKTAAVCVAKLYDISPELVEDRGFVDTLRDLISDANPTVVANAVSALSEIAETSNKDVMMVTANVLQKLLAALNECTEWGQVFILDSLSAYEPQDSREAEGIIERVMPRLQHNNSAVVMSAVKVILRYVDDVTNHEVVRNVSKKLAPPLVTLLNSEPEIQYVALRNINLVVLKQPRILEHEIKVFFCKYNDPIYVKMEKLEIIIRLASDRNVEQVSIMSRKIKPTSSMSYVTNNY
jgi:AP-1 complex subunit beta-1